MSMIKGVAARLRAIIRPAEADRDLDDQIALHLDLETEKYLRQGFAPDEARRRAVLAFGGVQQTREEHRETRTGRWLEETRRDVRIALRGLARRPAMTAAATLTLALGLGAVTALFSVVDAVILRPLPFPQPDRLVMLWEENPDRGWHQQSAAPANMLDWRERVRSLAAIGAYADFGTTTTLTGVGEPRLLHAAMVTGNLFDVLGVHPLHGRTFTEEETWSTADRVVMLSHATWRNIFGADTSLVGRTITLGGNPWRVAGIMPATFAFPRDDVEIWVPMRWNPASSTQIGFRRAHWMRPVARLAPGVTPQRANAELRDVAARMMEEYPETNTRMGAGLTPLHEFLIGNTRTPLLILLGATAILLALACVNVGNLLLGAAAEREREMALRLVLGAGRMRLVRQTITESLVLAGVGGVAGVALGWIGTRVLSAMQPDGLLRVRDVPMDWRVLAFAVAVTTVCGLVFALAPALWSGRRQPSDALREGGRTGSAGQRARRWGSTIVVAEVALALVLTVGAGLLVRSYWMLMRVHPGFDGRGVVTASLVLPGSRYDTGEKVDAFWEELVRRTRGMPGVEQASAIRQVPLGDPSWSSDFTARGWPSDRFGTEVVHREALPGYFATMGVPIIRGRDFTSADRAGTQNVVIVNDVLAKTYFPDADPIGQVIAFDRVPDSTSVWRTIVGVVGSERQRGLSAEPRAEIFAPVTQDRTMGMVLVARTDGDPALLAPGVRRIVSELDPLLAITALEPMADIRARSLARDRFFMTLLLVFAGVGLALAVVGVYGVLGQVVTGRRREIGIRVALGAVPAQLRWHIVRHGLRLTAIGLVLGAAAALASTRAMDALLYQVRPADPATYAAVGALLLATSVLAAWWPARRASRADPVEVLRND